MARGEGIVPGIKKRKNYQKGKRGKKKGERKKRGGKKKKRKRGRVIFFLLT